MADQRFLCAYRITRGGLSAGIPASPHRRRRPTAGVCLPQRAAHPRLGLSVSRKVGNAVVRNRWKPASARHFGSSREQLPCGVDLVVIPRPDAVPRTSELQESLVKWRGGAAKRI